MIRPRYCIDCGSEISEPEGAGRNGGARPIRCAFHSQLEQRRRGGLQGNSDRVSHRAPQPCETPDCEGLTIPPRGGPVARWCPECFRARERERQRAYRAKRKASR